MFNPTFQDANGRPCKKDDPKVKYMVIGNTRTCTDGKPQILVNGIWTEVG